MIDHKEEVPHDYLMAYAIAMDKDKLAIVGKILIMAIRHDGLYLAIQILHRMNKGYMGLVETLQEMRSRC